MPDDDERMSITVQSLSDAALIKLLQHHDDDELAEIIERKKEGGSQ
jgi:hypothetical protein